MVRESLIQNLDTIPSKVRQEEAVFTEKLRLYIKITLEIILVVERAYQYIARNEVKN